MKQIEVVAAIIHDKEGRIFATQRGYGDYKDGWEFPGGKMELGENPEQALKREIWEELETEINQLGEVDWLPADQVVVNQMFTDIGGGRR